MDFYNFKDSSDLENLPLLDIFLKDFTDEKNVEIHKISSQLTLDNMNI